MDVQTVFVSQYHAALDMLEQAVTRCPEALWNDPTDQNRFWQVSYHTLFYVHLYLQPTEAEFTPWPQHRPDYEEMAQHTDTPYSQAEVLDYLAFCREQVDRHVPALDPAAASGFSWLPFDKLELQVYNIRHLQLHTGELCERLWARAQVEIGWVGRHHQEVQ